MASHVIAFTAEFKIDAVRKGDCTQTIRPERKRPIQVGDNLLLHGWDGLPYRTPWSWRAKAVCTETFLVKMWKGEDYWLETPLGGEVFSQRSKFVEDLAKRDWFEDEMCSCGHPLVSMHLPDGGKCNYEEWVGGHPIVQCDCGKFNGKTAAEKMFEYFDNTYKLSNPKVCSVIRWRLANGSK